MKKIYAIGFAMVACCGCTNADSVPVELDGKDTGASIPQPPPSSSDTSTINRDTGMYKRVPGLLNDSVNKKRDSL